MDITEFHPRLWDVLRHLCSACIASGNTPLPEAMPVIVWRVGLDLNPVDVNDEDQVAWLETAMVWPEEMDRLAHLRAALAIAKNTGLSSSVVTCEPTFQHWRRGTQLAVQRCQFCIPLQLCSPIWNDLTDCASENLCVECPLHGFPTEETPQIVSDIVEEPPLPHPSGSFLLTVDGHPQCMDRPSWSLDPVDRITPLTHSARRLRLDQWVR